ncbi:hypothetical protein [Microcoleus sp. CAWBG27]|uniref:hypothetical protein n=1 Tax=Microcoleus sp. CAWBG27 TaxID=2841645 RepID=UPI0025CF61AB|nr:hypothetical protein [Microcoleus sp. CAWBG27]
MKKFNPLPSGFVCVEAVSTAELIEEIQPAPVGFCLCRSGFNRRVEEIQPAEAGFVCVEAVSTAELKKFNPLPAGFVCVEAVSTAELKKFNPLPSGFVCVEAVSTAELIEEIQPAPVGFCLCRSGFNRLN